MARGKINLQANDGTVIGLVVPDGLTSGERQISLGVNLSGITAYHLLQGNLAVSNSTITQGFNTTLFTRTSAGNLVVDTGIDMNTQWGNTADERFGGLVWVKDRVSAGLGHVLQDTIRGAGYYLQTNNTIANTYLANTLVSFNNNGFTYGDNLVLNAGQVGWNFQTTHRASGITNHGKAYTCHFNPFTGFTIVKYEGSGIAGHEIPHHLGRKLGFFTCKQLDGTYNWVSQYRDGYCLYLNATMAEIVSSTIPVFNETNMSNGTTLETNGNNLTYIMYGWANSYFDESNKLIGNYELVTYQGTGAAGNKVKTKGKPAWVMIKRLDSTEGWFIHDNQRLNGTSMKRLVANITQTEQTDDASTYSVVTASDGFIINNTATAWNAAGGQYLALVAYDTNSNGGGSYYPLASDTANVQINNALIPLAQGIDSNGTKVSTLSKNETITGLTYTQGKNYVYCDKNGAYGVTPYKPRYLESELVRTYASEAPEYYDVVKNKWSSTDTGAELITNGTFTDGLTGWTYGGTTTPTVSNGLLTLTTGTTNGYVYRTITTTIGKRYKIVPKFSTTTGTYLDIALEYPLANLIYHSPSQSVIEFTANSSTTTITLSVGAVAGSVVVDSISVFASDIVPTTEITNSRNYLNHIVHADNDGGVLYVEELPKVEYKDIVKANEFKGKNACTAWVNFDGATTPPTIRDSYNVSAVIRIGTGTYDIYFKEAMDNINYASNISANKLYSWADSGQAYYNRTVSKVSIMNVENGIGYNTTDISVQVFGGRN